MPTIKVKSSNWTTVELKSGQIYGFFAALPTSNWTTVELK